MKAKGNCFIGDVEITWGNDYLDNDEGKVASLVTTSEQTPQQAAEQFDILTARGFTIDLLTGIYHSK